MTSPDDKIPKNHGEFYFEPRLPQWKEEALRNRERLVKETFWGLSPLKVRAALKLPTNQPLILSGHQPVFFHPGLWAKCLAAGTLAEAVQGTACHKVTDTALAPEFLHYVPEVEENGRARRKQLDFFSTKDVRDQAKTNPYVYLPAPHFNALEKIFSDMQVYCPAPVKKNVKAYEDKLYKGLKANAGWNDFHLFTLKMLDELCGTRRLYFTAGKTWSTEPFYHFTAQWLLNLPELNDCYNQALKEYREKYKITHDLTPVPNLKFEDWWFEIPFWGVTKYHQRHSIWAKNDGKHIILKIKGGDGNYSLALDNLEQELGALPLNLWPKAIPQTLFCRMYLCDFFIHGTGGGSYEEVGDLLFTKYFKLKPLAFGVVSATYQVDPEESRAIEVILDHEERIRWWQRALEKNPEYLFTRADAWRRELPAFMHPSFKACLQNEALRKQAEGKSAWVEGLKDPARRSDASRKIKETNAALLDGCTEVLKVLEQGLLDAEKVKEMKDVLAFREYPFFCYPPDIFVEMKEKIRESAHQDQTVDA